MKDKIKKLLLLSLALMPVIAAAGCANQTKPEETELSETDMGIMRNMEDISEQLVTALDGLSDEELDEYIVQAEDAGDSAQASGYEAWKEVKDELGFFVGIDEVKSEKIDDDTYRVTIDAEYDERDCEITLEISTSEENGQIYLSLDDMSFSPEYTREELSAQAAEEMAVGAGKIAAALVGIVLIIVVFRYISNPERNSEKKASEKPGNEPAEITESGAAVTDTANKTLTASGDELNDEEICAVIAAAIAEYEAENGGKEPSNGLIVRSIKRVPNVIKKRS